MKNTKKLVTTAVLLALTVVFQYLRFIIPTGVSTYVIGTLVNVCLIIAAVMVGLWGGVAVSVLAPLIAWLQGYANIAMVPWIMAGNVLLVLGYALFISNEEAWDRSRWVRWIIVGVIASVLKYLVISLGMTVAMLMPKGKAFGVGFISALTVGQLQQIITALIAMVLSKLVIIAIPKSMSLR